MRREGEGQEGDHRTLGRRPPAETRVWRMETARSGLRARRLRRVARKASNWARKRWFAVARERSSVYLSSILGREIEI